MTDLVSLNEAATFLGVTKTTLRNWDKAGKLKAVRNPVNGYRLYKLDELREVQDQHSLFEDGVQTYNKITLDKTAAHRLAARVHNAVRDNESNSSILWRFEEISKVYVCRSKLGDDNWSSLSDDANGAPSSIRATYDRIAAEEYGNEFRNFRSIELKTATLQKLFDILDTVSFDNADFDVYGLLFEEVLKNTFDKGDNQQYFTPPQVVEFMVDLVEPFMGGRICDPASGTGGFLVEIARRKLEYKSLTALEIDQRLAWSAHNNLMLHEANAFSAEAFENGGSLGAGAKKYFNQFDLIVTNPPFGSDYSNKEDLEQYTLGKGKNSRRRGILFLERCFDLLKEGGTLAIIIDEGVLNLSHAKDVRSFILDHFQVKAIISLPETCFMPYASVNASILLLKKSVDPSGRVFFAKADQVGRKSNGQEDIIHLPDGSFRLNSDLPRIYENYTKTVKEDELSYFTEGKSLCKQNDELRLDYRFHHPFRFRSQRLLDECEQKKVALKDLVDVRNDKIIPAKDLPDQVISYTGLAHIASGTGHAVQETTPTNSLKSAVNRYEAGDIVFATMRPNLRKIAILEFSDGGYVSPECLVLTVKKDDETGEDLITPRLLATLLRSDLVFGQILHLVAGIGRPRISKKEVLNVLIPLPPKNLRDKYWSDYEDRIERSDVLRKKAAELEAQAENEIHEALTNLASSFAR